MSSYHPRFGRFASFFAALLLGGAAQAAPQFVRVSLTNPDDAGTTATISWNTPNGGAPTTVEYGLTSSYGSTATGTTVSTNGPVGEVHVVELTGLEPLTDYHYRVGGTGDWSGDFSFRTGPPADKPGCEPVRFVAMGDGRSNDDYGPAPHWKSILAEAVAHQPHAIVLTGDQVNDGDDHEQWLHWLEDSAGPIASVPIMPSLGNHDDDQTEGDDAIYNKVFSVPTNIQTNTEDYYYFTIGNAIFVSLSSQTFDGGATPMAEQAAWLDQVLTENPKMWKFVYFHHPPYTGVLGLPGLFELNHEPNEKGQNAALVPIFDKHHVDIVFNGHNHHYQRFKPMCCGGSDDIGTVTNDFETGTVYVITGGAGALTYDLSILGLDLPALLCQSQQFGQPTESEVCDGRHHYVMVEIDGLDLTYTVYTTASQLLGSDPNNIEVIDTFTISKSGPEPECGSTVPDPGPEPGPEPAPEVVPDASANDGGATVPDAAPSDAGGPSDAGTPGDATSTLDTNPSDAAGTPDQTATPDAPAPVDATTGEDTSTSQPDGTTSPPQVDGSGIPAPDATVGSGGNVDGESSGCAASTPTEPLVPALLGLLLMALGLRRSRRAGVGEGVRR